VDGIKSIGRNQCTYKDTICKCDEYIEYNSYSLVVEIQSTLGGINAPTKTQYVSVMNTLNTTVTRQ